MLSRRNLMAAAMAAGIAVGAFAAEPEDRKPEGPKPPPEADQLSYFMGPWSSEGEVKAGPAGAGGSFQGREMCRWMPGKFFLGCMAETRGPAGASQSQSILGYDADKKAFVAWSFDNEGRAETGTGTLKDGTWTWIFDTRRGGQASRLRYVMSDTKPDSYAMSVDSSTDGKTWTPVLTAKYTKMQPRPVTTAMPRPTPGAAVAPPAPVPTPKKN